MSGAGSNLNEHGNQPGEFTQGVGGWAEYSVVMTKIDDTVRHDVAVPPGKVIPVIFLPGVMGSNLRVSKRRQDELRRDDNRSWRPDDIVSSKSDILSGRGYGGWFKNATPAQRQLIFDQNETEVEYYHYTESKDRFDPEGKETLAEDVRHHNVPHDLSAIPPLMGARLSMADFAAKPNTGRSRRASPAQIARWRGWSEVLFGGAYGTMLKTAELFLNNMMTKGRVGPLWQSMPTDENGKPMLAVADRPLSKLLLQKPQAFGGAAGKAITESDIKKIAPCWYPVHAMGYNFVRSNGQSAKIIAERIRGMVKGYQQRGFKCDEVIIVTHSMGGLLARALIHPSYGNLLKDSSLKVLGIYHNVMPTLGAAGAYKRMRFGFQEKSGFTAETEAKILGIDGRHATAILANAPAPLEMMPGAGYGANWLKVIDGLNRPLASWPSEKQTALEHIYLQPENAWWRLLNPLWVNPGNLNEKAGGGIEKVKKRLTEASKFLHSIETTFHTNTFASYCASQNRLSYGEIVFKITSDAGFTLPPPETWTLLTDDAKGKITVQAGREMLTLQLQPASAAGDETVPSNRSAKNINGTLFTHGVEGQGYEHQNSYADPHVLASMLYSIVQIAKTAKWA
ncbi:esterase/lipase family protein [Massilia sp. TWR1-2-2]|uniref:esterase/lipase family protein n=1 Tax=Massilia sp. TWR1-2-2 TaxID=2804584 RepID=UPI003CF11F53